MLEEIRFVHCCTLYTKRDLDFVRRNTLWALLYFIYEKGFGLCQKKYALGTAVLYIQKRIWTLSEEIRFGHCCTLYTKRDLDFVRRNTLWALLYFIYKKGFGLTQQIIVKCLSPSPLLSSGCFNLTHSLCGQAVRRPPGLREIRVSLRAIPAPVSPVT